MHREDYNADDLFRVHLFSYPLFLFLLLIVSFFLFIFQYASIGMRIMKYGTYTRNVFFGFPRKNVQITKYMWAYINRDIVVPRLDRLLPVIS